MKRKYSRAKSGTRDSFPLSLLGSLLKPLFIYSYPLSSFHHVENIQNVFHRHCCGQHPELKWPLDPLSTAIKQIMQKLNAKCVDAGMRLVEQRACKHPHRHLSRALTIQSQLPLLANFIIIYVFIVYILLKVGENTYFFQLKITHFLKSV